jgi:hypothetical protein
MDNEPECYKCRDWRRMGLSDRCPYHDQQFWALADALERAERARLIDQQDKEQKTCPST